MPCSSMEEELKANKTLQLLVDSWKKHQVTVMLKAFDKFEKLEEEKGIKVKRIYRDIGICTLYH